MLDKLKRLPKNHRDKQTLKAIDKDQVCMVFIAKMPRNTWCLHLKKYVRKKVSRLWL